MPFIKNIHFYLSIKYIIPNQLKNDFGIPYHFFGGEELFISGDFLDCQGKQF